MPLVDAANYPLWINAAVFVTAAAVVWAAGTKLARYVGRIRAPWTLRGEGPPPCGPSPPLHERPRLRPLVVKTAIAGAVILVAGFALSRRGDALRQQLGIGSGIVGFLLLGASTSLPELSTIVATVRAGQYSMAIGDVFGTNFVNVSLILLADAAFRGGPVIAELGRFEIVSSLLGVTLTGVYLVGLLEHRHPLVLRIGYDSAAVMLLFAGGLALLFSLQ
jgi:cation:H+ antiporter